MGAIYTDRRRVEVMIFTDISTDKTYVRRAVCFIINRLNKYQENGGCWDNNTLFMIFRITDFIDIH